MPTESASALAPVEHHMKCVICGVDPSAGLDSLCAACTRDAGCDKDEREGRGRGRAPRDLSPAASSSSSSSASLSPLRSSSRLPPSRVARSTVESDVDTAALAAVDLGSSAGLGLHGAADSGAHARSPAAPLATPRPILQPSSSSFELAHSQSLPTQHAMPWSTARAGPSTRRADDCTALSADLAPAAQAGASRANVLLDNGKSRARAAAHAPINRLPNPLLDMTNARVPSGGRGGRGCLYAGSTFKGTQTSGRSAYEVEVNVLDVSFADSTLCGYLSISHLTDTHPHLTTFFTAEIIGPRFGFVTGARFGATEHDDMRHWGRFEQFRRAATRADFVRPELRLRDPLPDAGRGETRARERDFVFLRIKERFLVPDHRVRDISGASFAGFYYAMVDMSPTLQPEEPPTPRTPSSPTTPVLPRRASSTTNAAGAGPARSPSRPDRPELRTRRGSSRRDTQSREATIRGEPFQELSLTHVPERSTSTFELR